MAVVVGSSILPDSSGDSTDGDGLSCLPSRGLLHKDVYDYITSLVLHYMLRELSCALSFMPSLIGKGMESTSGQQTLPPVKFRANLTPDVEQSKDSTYKGPDAGPSSSGKGASVSSASKEARTSVVDAFNIKDAIYSYAVLCRDGTASSEELKQHIVNWVEHLHCQNRKGGPSGAGSFVDFAACAHCQCLLNDPVTITCGHTYCKMCLGKLSLKTCVKCGQDRHRANWAAFKTNVVIAEVLSKWWPDELKAVQLKAAGSKLFIEDQIDKAIEKYTQAVSAASNSDHLLASNLSHAHLQMGQAVLALQYAETTIKLRPDWPKGYFRKGFALLSLSRYEDAAVALLQCLALEPQLPSTITELTKIMHQIIPKLCKISKPYLNQSLRRGSENRESMTLSAYATQVFKRRFHVGSLDNSADKSSDEEDDTLVGGTSSKRKRRSSLQVPLVGFERLSQFLDRCQISVDMLKKIELKKVKRPVDQDLLDKNDFECTLCLRTFWQPVTTPCGHVFCRVCLDRCLDHTPRCPLCKSSLEDYLAERRQFVTEFIDVAIETYIPEAYVERRQSHLEEMNELTKNAEESNREMPIFVCTVGFPTVPCPLHVFEPRYRLMIRRCLETGSRVFGMCAPQEGSHNVFSDYGTTLEIRDVQYFPDGRAVVDAVGRKRFRVLERSMKDGYHTATIEFLEDQPGDENETRQLHDAVHSEVLQWFGRLNPQIKNRILGHFGPMPERETDHNESANGPAWVWWTLAILPLDARGQLAILSMTSLRKRLEALHRTLSYMLKGHS